MTREEHKKIRAILAGDTEPVDLKTTLAGLLPDLIRPVSQTSPDGEDLGVLFWWKDERNKWLIGETEWDHICYLIRVKHALPILVGSNEPWQEQGRHILRYMEASEAVVQTITG